MTKKENRFYVYMYLRADGTPYYVGKGCRDRRWQKSGRTAPPPADLSRNIIYKDNLTETAALELEVELIARWGRKDLGAGILRNLTNGGEGSSGYRHTKEHRQNLSGENNPMYGRKRPELSERMSGENNPMYGRKCPEHSERISGENNPNSKLSDAQRQEIRYLYSTGCWTYRRLAEKFGVSQRQIGRILKQK